MGCGQSNPYPPGRLDGTEEKSPPLNPRHHTVESKDADHTSSEEIKPEKIELLHDNVETKTWKSDSHEKADTHKSKLDSHEETTKTKLDSLMSKPSAIAKFNRKASDLKKARREIELEFKKHGNSARPRTSHRHLRGQAKGTVSRSATEEVIRGNVNVECPSTAKIVRIFTSSTFTDTRHERNALMERVYPRLKELCQQLGYEFQIVDMRWGIRDESTDDHMGTELCLREVEQCKKLSTGPYFVTFLSHKYGYRAFPNKIEAKEFELLYSGVEDDKSKQLLDLWFKKDDNAVPPTYILQPISSILPAFRDQDEEKRKSAKSAWNEQSSHMQAALVTSSSEKLDSAHAHRYLMSVTEAEIERGTGGTPDKLESCLWFHRIIENIEQQPANYILSRYKDCNGPEEKVKESQILLKELRDKTLPKLVKTQNHKIYNIKWTKQGIDPEKNKDHKKYIGGLCEDFEKKVSEMIRDAIEQRKKTDLANPLYAEIVEHTVFCQEKCKAFHGRQGTLDTVAAYLVNGSKTPFVVHGPSGCGKTSIVAMAAKLVLERFKQDAGIIIRFIGTTPDSSTIGALLSSVIRQIWRIYDNDEDTDLPADIKELTVIFHKSLNLASAENPLVLLLDSLDQFDPSSGARQLAWLPKELPNNVKMILSTLPEAQYESFPKLKDMFKTTVKTNFLAVPKLEDNDVEGILNKWLSSNHRSLTMSQRQVVLDAFHKCPLPLFLKLSFDEACRWPSFAVPSQTVLEESVRGSINALFERVEGLHGKVFVSRALAYLTMSKTGLSESELEDILSCDDDVLNDVYTYWTPPIRRLPPLLLVRLKAELGQYLVDRGADGVRVFFWYHRQFIEAATDRYCKEAKFNQKLHSALADFFAGTWANGKSKPYMSREGKQSSADRKVASQPDKFSTAYNLRKLNNLPHQRTEAHELDKLKMECLLNFPFLMAKLQASGLRYILDDFMAAREVYPEDEQLKTVGECLQLSQDALISYSKELPSQLLNRLAKAENLEDFLKDCAVAPDYYLLPNRSILTPPGGQLLHCLAGHKGDIEDIDMTNDGKFVATCASDKSAKVWDVDSGKLVRSLDVFEDDPGRVLFCCRDTIMVVQAHDNILAFKLSSGAKVYEITCEDDKRVICVGGKGKTKLGAFDKASVFLYEAKNGQLIQKVKCNLLRDKDTFSDWAPCIGSHRYMAIQDRDQFQLFIVDLTSNTFIHKKEIFPKFIDDDGEEDQYTIDTMTFSRTGDVLYISNMYTNNVHIYNTKTMNEVKVFKGEESDTSDHMKLTRDEKYLYVPNNHEVVVWNVPKEERFVILKQGSSVNNVVMQDMTRAVSIGDDRVVRIFDLTREASEDPTEDQEYLKDPDEISEDEDEDKKDKKKIQLTFLKTLPNPRYVLLKKSQSSARALQIYDLALDKPVKNILMTRTPNTVEPLPDSKHIMVVTDRKVKIVNLVSAKITTRFQGKIANSNSDVLFVRERKEIAAKTRGGHRVKLLSMASGKVVHIFKTETKQEFDDLKASEKGGILLASVSEGPVYVFDVVGRTCLYLLSPKELGSEDLYINDAVFTNDDAFFVLQICKIPEKAKKDNIDTQEYICVCWDVKQNRVKNELVDYEMYRKYLDDKDSDQDTCLDVFAVLDNRTVISNHNDCYIRVFDIISGEMKHRLDGHSSATLTVPNEGPYFMSQGLYREDNTFKFIDKTSFEMMATFSPDVVIKDITMSKDGYHAVGYFRDDNKPVFWKLEGGPRQDPRMKSYKPLSSFPNIYGKELVRTTLQLFEKGDDEKDDPDDPDSDQEDPDEEGPDTDEGDPDESLISSLSDFSLSDLEDDPGKPSTDKKPEKS